MKNRVIKDIFVGEVKVGVKSWKIKRFEGGRKTTSDGQNSF